MSGKLILHTALYLTLVCLAMPLQAEEYRQARDRMIGKLASMASEAPKQEFTTDPLQFFVLGADLGGSARKGTDLKHVPGGSREFTKQFERPVWYFETDDGHSGGLLVMVLGTSNQLLRQLTAPESDAFWGWMMNDACAVNEELILELGYKPANCFKMYDNMDSADDGIFTRGFFSISHSSGPQSSRIQQGMHLFVESGYVFGVIHYDHEVYTPSGKLTPEEFGKVEPFENRKDFMISVIRNSTF